MKHALLARTLALERRRSGQAAGTRAHHPKGQGARRDGQGAPCVASGRSWRRTRPTSAARRAGARRAPSCSTACASTPTEWARWPTPSRRSASCPIRWARSRRAGGAPTASRSGRVRMPLGVILMIYEARPNVTSDAAALCLKSGNAVLLRGGKEALRTNTAVAAPRADGLAAAGLPADAVQLDPGPLARAPRRSAAAGRPDRPVHPPRRPGADPLRRRARARPGGPARRGRLPRLRRRRGRPRAGRPPSW